MIATFSKLRIIVSGLIAQYPLGGVAWDYFQYVLGLHNLGHDVYYFEDTGQWPYNPNEGGVSEGCDYNVKYLASLMERFGLDERWAYCGQSGGYMFPSNSRWFGLSNQARESVIQSADLLINVSGTLMHPWDYRSAKCLIYIDSDPVFTQVKLARGQADFRRLVDAHDVHFSFGEALSNSLPATGHDWLPTRQPVVLSQWQPCATHRDVYTTVMNWTSYKPVAFNGHSYGQKDIEFRKFIDLPALVAPQQLELAVNSGKVKRTPRQWLIRHGWRIVDPEQVCSDFDAYRNYVATSKAEWSVAKNGYVKGGSGWFSCRSACYLAAGRPVVVQDTGFSSILPTGEGLHAFTTLEQAAQAIEAVNGDYQRHCKAARELARQYFDSDQVLTRLIEDAFQATSS